MQQMRPGHATPLAAAVLLCAALAPRAAAAEARKPTIAVLYFDYDGTDEEMGFLRKGLTQMLVTDLSSVAGVDIVERVRLEEALAELKLGTTNKIDKRSASRVGKLLGARYLIMGGYFDFGGTLRVDARVVEVETGVILASLGGSRKVAEFLELEQKLAADLAAFLRDKLAVTDRPARPRGPAGANETKDGAAAVAQAGPKRPKRLLARTAARYGKGLDARDRGDTKTARRVFKQVLKEQPDFALASVDLASLAK